MSRKNALKGRMHDNTLVLADGVNGEWGPHDLRRTGSTGMQRLGIDEGIIDRCLNHALPGSRIRRHYFHHGFEEQMREAWRAWGDHLDRVLSKTKVGDPSGSPAELDEVGAV